MSVRTLIVCAAVLVAAAAVVAYAGQPLAIYSIHAYQRTISPVADRLGARCRFTPTCSRYAEAVIRRDGLARGGWAALKRIARCGPWTPMGTHDDP
jgi:uncharacterized protein